MDFPAYWDAHARPRAEAKIKAIRPRLPSYDVVRAVKGVLGRDLPSDTITVYVLVYTQPHGIRITGSRYLTDVAWPFRIVISNAVHEMMHPPFDSELDVELCRAVEKIQTDLFVRATFERHDPSFGYNSFAGYVEEDLVQALDQLITERFGVAPDPRSRWRHSDGGMHVLAAALYYVMHKGGFLGSGVSGRDYFVRQVETGELQPGKVRSLYDALYGREARH